MSTKKSPSKYSIRFIKLHILEKKIVSKQIYFFFCIFNACFINLLQTLKNLIVLIGFLLA